MIYLVVLLMFAALLILAYFAIDQCAKANFIFTYVKEGHAKAIEISQAFKKIVMAYEGYTLDVKWNIIPESIIKRDKTEDPIPASDKLLMWISRMFFGGRGGLRWVGLPPYAKVHEYVFRWASQRVAAPTTEDAIKTEKEYEVAREEVLDDILLQDDIYLIKISEAEDTNLLPLDIRLLVTMRIINPYKALYRVQEWLEMITDNLRAICVPYIGGTQFREMIGATKENALAEVIWEKLNERKPRERAGSAGTRPEMSDLEVFEDDYGIRIKTKGVKVGGIDPTEKYAQKITDEAIKPWFGEQEEKAIRKRYAPFIGKKEGEPLDEAAMRRIMEIRRLEALEKISEGGNMILDLGRVSSAEAAMWKMGHQQDKKKKESKK